MKNELEFLEEMINWENYAEIYKQFKQKYYDQKKETFIKWQKGRNGNRIGTEITLQHYFHEVTENEFYRIDKAIKNETIKLKSKEQISVYINQVYQLVKALIAKNLDKFEIFKDLDTEDKMIHAHIHSCLLRLQKSIKEDYEYYLDQELETNGQKTDGKTKKTTIKTLIDIWKGDVSSMHKVLNRLVEDDYLIKVGAGKYKLKDSNIRKLACFSLVLHKKNWLKKHYSKTAKIFFKTFDLEYSINKAKSFQASQDIFIDKHLGYFTKLIPKNYEGYK